MRIYTFVIAALLFAAACKKSNDVGPQTSDISNIYGKWNWVQSTGGMAGSTLTPKTEGYTGWIEITTDNKFFDYRNNKLNLSASFSVSKDTGKLTNYTGRLYFAGSETTTYIIRATRDTLIMGDDFADGFTTLYIRKK